MVHESHDQQTPDDATVVNTHKPDVTDAAGGPTDDATMAAPRPAAAETPNSNRAPSTTTGDRHDAFTTRPIAAIPASPPHSVMRSVPVAIALGAVTGLVLFGVTALWLLHGR